MRGFSDEERDRIREKLVETGRELLVTLGPEKTNVADVTEPVGIAKSTFYRFFDSKADLYFEILQRESGDFREQLQTELEEVDDPPEAVERFFQCYVDFAEGNQLVQQMFLHGNYEDLLRDVSEDTLLEAQHQGVADFVPFIESFQEQSDGLIADLDPATVLGIQSAVGLLILHEDEYRRYEEGYYEQVRDALIASIARGLTAEE